MFASRKYAVPVLETALRSSYGLRTVSNANATLIKFQNSSPNANPRRQLLLVDIANNQYYLHQAKLLCSSSSSGSSGQIPNVSFKDVRNLKPSTTMLIDVRESHELNETGVLPGSINIPSGNVENAFRKLSNDKFKELYGKDKPKLDHPLVFSCRSGKRSMDACLTMKKIGYKNVSNYGGGWLDWEENIKNKK